jgi:sugar lactone lactonase YvrE
VSRWSVAVPARAELGERPVWDPAARRLIWVDILAGRLHRYAPGGRDEVFLAAGVSVGAAAPRRDGGYVLAAGDGFRFADAAGRLEGGPLRPPGMDADLRFNDGACDPAGRFWAGTVAAGRRAGAGMLYRLDPDRHVTVMLDGVTESNGIGWSPDGTLMYYIDSGQAQPRVRAFGYDAATGRIGAGRDLIAFAPSDGIPDGLAVDAQGALWIALWNGGEIRRYSAAGGLLDTVALPVSCPTCPGFGGPGLRELYVTSAWQDMDEAAKAAEPLAGHLFRITATASGQPGSGYAG